MAAVRTACDPQRTGCCYSANAVAVWFLTRFREIDIEVLRQIQGGEASSRGSKQKRSSKRSAAYAIFRNSLATRAWRPNSDTLLATSRLSGRDSADLVSREVI